jgi:hypothetical protein
VTGDEALQSSTDPLESTAALRVAIDFDAQISGSGLKQKDRGPLLDHLGRWEEGKIEICGTREEATARSLLELSGLKFNQDATSHLLLSDGRCSFRQQFFGQGRMRLGELEKEGPQARQGKMDQIVMTKGKPLSKPWSSCRNRTGSLTQQE